MNILVTGGTGTLGRLVIPRLRATGCAIRVLSRHSHSSNAETTFVVGDLTSGDGIDAATRDIEIIVHCAGSNKNDDLKAQHLVTAAARAGVRHLVFISVVGADRIPVTSAIDRAMFGYFASKLAAERVVAESGLPWTTLRATQFHELTLKVVQAMARLPIVPVPAGFRFQPVDGRDVADALVELALRPPAGLVPHCGGPRIYLMKDLVRSYLRATGKHRLFLPLPLPGGAAHAVRDGAVLAPDRAVGRRTWEAFLAEHVRS